MSYLLHALGARWRARGGYREVLDISLPLVASMASTTLMMFTDRVFLGRYHMDALAAVTPAALAAFTFMCLFFGIVNFVNTFVAQYCGTGELHRVGAAVWQGLWISLASGLVLALLAIPAPALFRLAGHAPEVAAREVVYFRILMGGAIISMVRDALLCFFSGRGLTRVVMVASLLGAAVNIPLDYALIFGAWGFPAWGIGGAAVATVAGNAVSLVLVASLTFTRRQNATYRTRSAWRLDLPLLRRVLRFGLPSGVQFFVDVFAFTFFIFLVGRLGDLPLAATNIAIAINTLAFLPMIGFAIAVTTLVGRAVGSGRPDEGETATRSALQLTMTYMVLIALVFVLLPGPLINLFMGDNTPPDLRANIYRLTVVLLRFVAVYTVFDTYNIIYIHALKGAGDTHFVGWTVFAASLLFMVVPLYLCVEVLALGIYAAWICLSAYVIGLALVFRWRFGRGAWKLMRVVEPLPPALIPPAGVPPGEEALVPPPATPR